MMKNKIIFYAIAGLFIPTIALNSNYILNKHKHDLDTFQASLEHNSGEHHHHQEHDHSQHNNQENYQASLTISGDLIPQENITLKIDIKDSENNLVTEFDIFHEYKMHLIAVSDDLSIFKHLHPEDQGNGRFSLETSLPQGGNYSLFADFKPKGQPQQVSVFKTDIEGENIATESREDLDFDLTKTFDNTEVTLSFSEVELTTGKDIKLTFKLKDSVTQQPIEDLQPYLGERGHLVIIKKSPDLTTSDYLHTHALKDSTTGKVEFMTQFPEPGKYKLWGEFKRNDEVITSEFWVNVN
jgi:hypothetical protein